MLSRSAGKDEGKAVTIGVGVKEHEGSSRNNETRVVEPLENPVDMLVNLNSYRFFSECKQ